MIRDNAVKASGLQIELILVNDSPDCPIQYQEDWVQGFQLRILTNERNLGIQGSRITGIRTAAGMYIQILDQDDMLAENALYSQFQAISGYDVVVANGIEQAGHHPGMLYTSKRQQRMATQRRFYYSIGCMITSPGQCLIRKEVIPECWMNHRISRNGADDLFLWLLLFETKAKWTINPDILYTHVNTGENFSADYEKMKASSLEVIDFMQKTGQISGRDARRYTRRFKMRDMYENRGTVYKVVAMLCYPDISFDLLRKKLYGRITRR